MSIYRFPAIADLPDNLDIQLNKILEEYKEMMEAYYDMLHAKADYGIGSKEYNKAREHFGIEILDSEHALESLQRIEFKDKEVEEQRAKVIDKNARRMYYQVSK